MYTLAESAVIVVIVVVANTHGDTLVDVENKALI